MVDSRAKGARGEYAVRDLLREYTKLEWERTPASGALPYLKGDLYIPNKKQEFVIEVKNYKESAITEKLLTSSVADLHKWWIKLEHQATSAGCIPLLFFKHDRSKWFIAVKTKPTNLKKYLYMNLPPCYIMLAEEWLKEEWNCYAQAND
jgi:Holliday junction resolvase